MHAVTTAPLPPPPRRATFADWLAEPDDRAAELIHGWLVYKALPSPEHGRAQRKLGALLDVFDGLPGEAGRPGGWWLSLLGAGSGDVVHAEPFDAIELPVALLLGDEPAAARST